MDSGVAGNHGNPAPVLAAIAEAGFTHVHWCHWWTGVKMYSPSEIEYIRWQLHVNGLKLQDTHATDGGGLWGSSYRFERKLVHDLIKNRLEFTAELGGRAIVLHAPVEPKDPADARSFWGFMNEDLLYLESWAREYGVAIALEQTDTEPRNIETLLKMVAGTDPQYIGFCWDTGHGHIHNNDHQVLPLLKDRLMVLHFNDNHGPVTDGSDPDTHLLPTYGSVNWSSVIELLGASSYKGPITLEVGHRPERYDGKFPKLSDFLSEAYARAAELHRMWHR
ncbi:MAG: sugar phosphate isomerase/epimerase [Candidatus Magasanikbacteria bacterium]|nr:sugar phosphate isomerase/epimerase [Candidatus Magasanikbacteria bacterium]